MQTLVPRKERQSMHSCNPEVLGLVIIAHRCRLATAVTAGFPMLSGRLP